MAINEIKKPIYCCGGATLDRKLKGHAVFADETSNPVSVHVTFGGVARNIAENLAHCTQEIHLQCVVGDDPEGKSLLQYMQQLNVDVSAALQIPNARTAQYYAAVQANGELYNAFIDMEIYQHIPFELFVSSWENWQTNSIVFLDTNLPTYFLEHALNQKNKCLKFCIDPVSLTKVKKLPLNLENVFLLKPNQLEIQTLTGIKIENKYDCFSAGHILLDKGVENVVISLGKNGYVIVNAKQQQHYPCLHVQNIRDVNGAGDAFVAGILLGLQQDADLIHACELGAAAAAFTLDSTDSVAKNISAKELTTFIHQHKKIGELVYAAIF